MLTKHYVKSNQSREVFPTKPGIMTGIFRIEEDNFNVALKIADSWYAGFKFLADNFVTEMKGKRKV